MVLSTMFGGFLGFVFLLVVYWFSFNVLGRDILGDIFGHSGLQSPIAILAGCILGWICGNRIKDNQEQARINREIEQDRLKHETALNRERFMKLNEEITAIGISNMGNFEEIERQSKAAFQRYGTTQAEFDSQLEENLRELRRWRDSGFKNN